MRQENFRPLSRKQYYSNHEDINNLAVQRVSKHLMPSKYYLLLVLNLPLIAEVVRKYAVWQDLVFLAGDAVAAGTFIFLLAREKLRFALPRVFYFLSAAFLAWGLLNQLMSAAELGVFFVGVRASFFPLVYLFLSAFFIDKYGDAINLLLLSASVWVTIAGAMALLQIHLGASHPINAIWGRQSLGIGDYAGMSFEVEKGLFRPASIFTHTGMFGQVVFLLVLFRWSVLAFSGLKVKGWMYLSLLIDLVTVAASGQRGAFIFLLTSLLVMGFFSARLGLRSFFLWLFGAVGLVAIVWILLALTPYGSALTSRFESGVYAIPSRVLGNTVYPLGIVLDRYLFFGDGFGFYTYGSRLFGGKVAWAALRLGESTVTRVSAEVGLIGAFLLAGMLMSITLRVIPMLATRRRSAASASAFFFVTWIFCLVLWSNTADVFANSVGTLTGSALGGGVLALMRNKIRRIGPVPKSKVARRIQNQTSGLTC